MNGGTCYEEGEKCCNDKQYDEALRWYRKGIDLFIHHRCFRKLTCITENLKWSEEQRQMLRDEAESGDASAMFLLGYLLYHGQAVFAQNLDEAFQLFCRGSDAGHMYNTFMKGSCLNYGHGTAQDTSAATQCYLLAAEGGVAWACIKVAWRYHDGTRGLPQDFHLAALYYTRATSLGDDCSGDVAELKRNCPMEVAPWTRWKPTPEIHSLVPQNVHNAMVTWLLINKRVSRDIVPMIMSYINTRDGW